MRTNVPIQAVIFDCDGTLVDSETLTAEVMFEVAVQHGFTGTLPSLTDAVTGTNMARSIEFINAHAPFPMPGSFADEVRALQAIRFRTSLREIEGASQLIHHLKACDIPFALATNGPRVKAELTLGITGMLPHFQQKPPHTLSRGQPDLIFSAYDHDTFKPDPGLFLLAAAALGVLPEACAVVEDSASGLAAGLAAGMQTFSLFPLQSLKTPLHPAPTELPALLDLMAYLKPTKHE
jgi:beta-phosphoglucomutase-like phosphatase (HAD superfamily)